MMDKPPPITPPRISSPGSDQRFGQTEEDRKTYLLLAAAIPIGVLLALVMLTWLPSLSNLGGQDGPLDQGESGTVVASLGTGSAVSNGGVSSDAADAAGLSTATAVSGTESGDDTKPNTQSEPIETSANSTRPASQVSTAETSQADGSGGIENEEEPRLLMVEPKRSVGRSVPSSLRGESLGGSGGANPFVGSGPPAKSTVYVIDVSGSMQTQDRLPRVISTLKRAVDLLALDQSFTVILFDQGFYRAPVGQGLILASKRNKQAIYDWLDNAPGGSGTNPLPAMLVAIQLRPERIVLLSDGEFDPSSAFAMTHANGSNARPARIDCVGLMEEVETLKEIAKANRGIYYQAQ